MYGMSQWVTQLLMPSNGFKSKINQEKARKQSVISPLNPCGPGQTGDKGDRQARDW